MAALLLYGSGSVAVYYAASKLVGNATSRVMDFVLNTNANENIKDQHVLTSISGMLDTYREMNSKHKAYNAMMAVRESLNKLKDTIQAAQLRKELHEQGYFTRFRTFDASADNKKIEQITEDLMIRLELFSKLRNC